MPPDNQPQPAGELVLYQTDDGRTRVECRFVDETVWLSQALIAEMYDKDVRTINEHLQNIFEDGELDAGTTIRRFRIVRQEGSREVARNIEYYSLDAILAVGYRVRSARGTQFRRWATERLREYLVKGFTMDDERLRNPPVEGSGVPDYFDELLERIRDIRASERRMYLRVTEIFALAADYQPSRTDTNKFFGPIQNKLHFAATRRTAAELIAERADHTQPNMGLTTWKGDAVRKSDATVAKNYLSEVEITELNRIVVMWLDFAEDQARRRKQTFLADWERRLEDFLRFNERDVLTNNGSVRMSDAKRRAEGEYERFAEQRRALLEAEGERTTRRALEEATRQLPARALGGTRPGRPGLTAPLAPRSITGMDYRDRIVLNPEIRFGKPTVRGTRITVGDVLSYLAAYDTEDEVLSEFPSLTREDLRACLAYAADRERALRSIPAA